MSILAAEEAPNPLLPPLGEIIIGLIAFGLVVWVMMKFVSPRFEQVFRARREAIEGGIERAEAMQAEAKSAPWAWTWAAGSWRSPSLTSPADTGLCTGSCRSSTAWLPAATVAAASPCARATADGGLQPGRARAGARASGRAVPGWGRRGA